MKESADSPLELYEKAYRLHYDEGRTAEACRIYKAIVDEFPDSNECGYAVIQLEKILAQSVSERINVSSRLATILAIASIVLSLGCLAAIFIVGGMYAKSAGSHFSSTSLMSQALGMMSVGKDKDALDLLAEIKSSTQNRDITPYMLCAELYLKKQQYAKAMTEFDAMRKIPGGESIAKEEMVKIKAEEENAMRKASVPEKILEDASAPQKAVEPAENPKPEPPPPPAKEIKPKAKKEAAAPARPAKQKKAGGLGRQDSISFF